MASAKPQELYKLNLEDVSIFKDNEDIQQKYFNTETDIMNKGKQQFDEFIGLLIYLFVDKYGDLLRRKKNVMVLKNRSHSYGPCLFITGGLAYRYYNLLIMNENNVIPPSTDYDITFCLEKLPIPEQKIENIIDIILIAINEYISQLYPIIKVILDVYAKNITPADFKKANFTTFSNIINDKIMLVIYKFPPVNTFTLKISFFTKDNQEIKFIDILFSAEDSDYNKIKELRLINVPIYPDLYLPVPDIDSLLKISLYSLINRGVNVQHYNKCFKDFLRIYQLLYNLSKVAPINYPILGYTPDKYDKLFKYIISIVPHCSIIIDETDKKQLKNFFDKINIINSGEEMVTIIQEIINEKKTLETGTQELNKSSELIKFNQEQDYFKQKYMEYKQKYLEAKAKAELPK